MNPGLAVIVDLTPALAIKTNLVSSSSVMLYAENQSFVSFVSSANY